MMKYNANPMSMREGKIYIDGIEIADTVSATINVTPEVWKGRQMGDKTPSSRWQSVEITGTIKRRRSTNWLDEIVAKYMKTKATPEFTIQGIMNDENSEYYERHGSSIVTVVGCVLTGNLPLIALDSGGEMVEDEISFNAKDIT